MTHRSVRGIRSRVSFLPIALLLAVFAVGLAACDSGNVPTPIPTVDPVAQALEQIPNTQGVTMRDDWAGLSPANPVLAHYTLRRASDGGLTGTADFQAGESRGLPVTATETIDIPGSVVKDFLARLAAIPLKEGEYVPKVEHTDDAPNIAITVQIPSGTASFYTQSQGDDHVPWAIALANKTYVVDSTAIAEAYALLQPYLKKDVLDRVVEEASNR